LRTLILAVVAMLVQQSFAFMATLVLPVVAPEVAVELGISPALIGAYSLCLYAVAVVSALACGSFIMRYGALRMSQVSLFFLGAGLLLAAPGQFWLFVPAAMLIGFGSAIATPASSEILARYSPPRYAPLIFSIKQTGVPVGGMLAGMLVPFVALNYGWRIAFLVTGLMCLALALVLQPLRAEYDRDRQRNHRLGMAAALETLGSVFARRELIELAAATFAFVGVQAIFGAFFVTYLVKGLGYELALAGQVFAGAQAVSIGARILWGWLASRFVSPRLMLALFGLSMAAACAATGLVTGDWGIAAVMAVAIAYSATAISFHGVLISEIARLSPSGRVGQTTGGVLAFASAGMMIYPAVFGLILGLTSRYDLGFFAAALPAMLAGLMFLRPLRRAIAARTRL